jgi:hypothetical protein
VPTAEVAHPILSYFSSADLLCKVLDDLTSQRDPIISKTVDLINKDAFLSVSKTLVLLRLELLPRGGFASVTPG